MLDYKICSFVKNHHQLHFGFFYFNTPCIRQILRSKSKDTVLSYKSMGDVSYPVWVHFMSGFTPQVFIPRKLATGLESSCKDSTRAATICNEGKNILQFHIKQVKNPNFV